MQALDFVVLGGEARQSQGLESFEFGQLCLAVGDAAFEVGFVVFEPLDLGVAGVGGLSGGVQLGELLVEVGLDVWELR